nr:hypothetical protein [Tanacetum cinerariifolium]
MVRDSVQLETALNTISHEYLLEFTSEYGISEMLHPELPGPGNRIVDFPEGKTLSRIGITAFLGGRVCISHCRGLANKCFQRWDAGEWYLLRGGCEGAGYASYPHPKTTGDVTMPGRYKSQILSRGRGFDTCAKSDKGEDWEPPSAPHELPLLTLTAPHVFEMDEPAAATDSSAVPSTIERSPLDFAHEAEASGRETVVPEMSPPEDVPITTAPGTDQAVETVAVEPPAVRESRKRGHEGIDANAPSKSLRRDHADLRPSGSSRGGKSLGAMQLCLASNVFVSEGVPANVSSPDQLAFADAPSSQVVAVAGDPEFENVARRDQRIQARESEIKNLEALLETEAGMKRDAEEKSAGLSQELERMRAQFSKLQATFEDYKRQQDQMVEQRCAEMDARLDALSVDFDEELYPHMLTTIAGRRWVIGHGLRLAMMKCAESLEMRQAFADVVSAGVAKGMSEGLKHGVEHGHAQLTVESLEAYDPEAEAKFAAALQSLKDLKYPLLDQLEGLKDAHIDLTIPVYPEVRNPRNPWACKEEIGLADAIAANISRAEQKKRSRIVCRTHGVGSAHHARSDRVPVSAPIVVPQGLALLLVDAATQTESDDA